MEIYLDNTATSFPKAEAVYQAVYDFIRNIGVNGRAGCIPPAPCRQQNYETRRRLAKLFGIKEISWIVFTASVTEAINLALKGIHFIVATM